MKLKLKKNKKLNFVWVCNGEIDFSNFEHRKIKIEQKINQGARLTNHRIAE